MISDQLSLILLPTYCEVYKALFSRVEQLATELSRARLVRRLPILQRVVVR